MARDTFDNKDEMDAPARSDGLGNALVIVTTICLLGALFLIEKAMGDKYNAGMFRDDRVVGSGSGVGGTGAAPESGTPAKP